MHTANSVNWIKACGITLAIVGFVSVLGIVLGRRHTDEQRSPEFALPGPVQAAAPARDPEVPMDRRSALDFTSNGDASDAACGSHESGLTIAKDGRRVQMQEWISDVENNMTSLESESLGYLLSAGIAGVMDSAHRGVTPVGGEKVKLPPAGSSQRALIYNGTVYIFADWEFPEYGQYHRLRIREKSDHDPATDEEKRALIADIVGRAYQALSLAK